MPGFNPDNINIHDLTIEEPEKNLELPFDVEKNITKEDFEEVVKSFKESRDRGSYDFTWEVLAAKVIDPTHDFKLDKDNFEHLTHQLEKCIKDENWMEFFENAMAIKAISPNTDIGLDRVESMALPEMERSLKWYKELGEWENVSRQLMEVKISVGGMGRIFNPTKEDWKSMEGHLEKLREENRTIAFLKHAMAMRIIDPQYNPDLNKKDWKEAEASLQNHKESKSGWLHTMG